VPKEGGAAISFSSPVSMTRIFRGETMRSSGILLSSFREVMEAGKDMY